MIPIDVPISKLVQDPARCAIYGLTPDSVIVFDTRLKAEAARIPLIAAANDLDVSADGARALVAHAASRGLSVIDLQERVVSDIWAVPAQPGRAEITVNGTAFYVTLDQWSDFHQVDLATGSDTLLGTGTTYLAYQADIELSADDLTLYVGDGSYSDGVLEAFDVSGDGFGVLARSQWDDNFIVFDRHVFVSRAGNAYYAEHQWRAEDLEFVTAGLNEAVLAEDDAGRIAVGTDHIWDATIGLRIGSHPAPITAAAFAAAGQELWTYSPGTLRYASTDEIIGGAQLGVREVSPSPLGDYSLEQLLYDPTRDVLYGRDSGRNAVVVIDATTLLPTVEVRVGTAPSDLALDPGGTVLYVGHGDIQGIGRIATDPIQFLGFTRTPKLAYEVEPAGPGRVVFNDRDMSTNPVLFDVATGQVRAEVVLGLRAAAIAVQGNSLYAGESGTSFAHMYRYTIGSNSLVQADTTDQGTSAGFSNPARVIALGPAGTDVFYGLAAIEQQDLSVQRYSLTQQVRTVTPDGRVALSDSRVWDRASGAELGSLPVASTVQAIEPTSTRAYLATTSGIVVVDLQLY